MEFAFIDILLCVKVIDDKYWLRSDPLLTLTGCFSIRDKLFVLVLPSITKSEKNNSNTFVEK